MDVEELKGYEEGVEVASTINKIINAAQIDFDNINHPVINVLPGVGEIQLTDNSINSITPVGTVTFVLPNISDNITFHQILVQINLSTIYSINAGTTHFFNSKTPDLSTAGKYNIIYEYDKANSIWVCGWMRKS